MHASDNNRHLALDLGTSTLAGQLLDSSGRVRAEARMRNPQVEMGADILSRLQRAAKGEGVALQSLLRAGLRSLLKTLLADAQCKPASIVSAAAAGNPGMSCMLRNALVAGLLEPPHKPPFKELTIVPVEEFDFGLTVPLELFPLVSGFVGGDLVAGLFSLGDVKPGTLFVDIGTNAEIALWCGSHWLVTSAAAGPAFEGGNIAAGMIMTHGAITDVRLEGDDLRPVVAGAGQPKGICGSGLAALVAASIQGGLIDQSGRIVSANEVDNNLVRYLVKADDSLAICFHRSAERELLLSQADLRNFQLAKGAVRAGVQLLLERGGFEPENVPRVLLTGALGTSLSGDVLKRVALMPEPMLDKTSFVANGVLAGLRAYLEAAERQQRLQAFVKTLQPFPLSGNPAFERLFLGSLDF